MKKLNIIIMEQNTSHKLILKSLIENNPYTEGYVASNASIAWNRCKQIDVNVIWVNIDQLDEKEYQVLLKITQQFPNIYWIFMKRDTHTLVNALREIKNVQYIKKPNISKEHTFERFYQKMLSSIVSKMIPKKESFHPADRHDSLEESLSYQHNRNKETLFQKADVIVIAASTGGPKAIEIVCSELTKKIRVPVLIVQHMPARFTQNFANSLDRKCELDVVEAKNGEVIKDGVIMIAPGGINSKVIPMNPSTHVLKTTKAESEHFALPSADIFFKSISQTYEKKNILAIVLTGMGSDGRKGLGYLKEYCNCYCIIQNEESCTIYSMPRNIKVNGLSDEELHIKEIGKRILAFT